jgi:hypothetical protein
MKNSLAKTRELATQFFSYATIHNQRSKFHSFQSKPLTTSSKINSLVPQALPGNVDSEALPPLG